MTREIIEKKLVRMAYEIVERNVDEEYIVLAGIRESGFVIASKILEKLKPLFKGHIHLISLQLDKKNPAEVIIEPPIEVKHKVLILIDDVANTGRTILYAMRPFLAEQPKTIQTLVLVERTHKLFPVTSDYVGLSISTTIQENIVVDVNSGEVEGAYLQ